MMFLNSTCSQSEIGRLLMQYARVKTIAGGSASGYGYGARAGVKG